MLYSLGLFSLMPVLAVLLATVQHGTSTAFVGTDLFIYTAAAGVGSLPVSKWLQRLPYALTLSGGLFLSAAGFCALGFVRNPLALFAALLLAGLGYSVHLVFSRVLITEMVAEDAARHRIYSILQIAVNVSAAFGPFIAVYLYSLGHGKVLLGGVAACYTLAGLTVLLRVPSRLAPPRASTQWAISRATFRMVLHDRLAVHVVVSTTVGSFVYAQFYSAFTLMVARQVGSELLRAVLLAVPAISIVIAQTSVSWLVGKALIRGVHVSDVLVLATVVFGIAMLPLGAGVSVVADAWVGVCVFSCAEMLFTPTVSTAFGTLPSASRLEAFNLRQVSWTIGEAAGAWCGGSVFLYCLDNGVGRIYWLAVGAVTLLGMSALVLTARTRRLRRVAVTRTRLDGGRPRVDVTRFRPGELGSASPQGDGKVVN
jgi:MFS family permease